MPGLHGLHLCSGHFSKANYKSGKPPSVTDGPNWNLTESPAEHGTFHLSWNFLHINVTSGHQTIQECILKCNGMARTVVWDDINGHFQWNTSPFFFKIPTDHNLPLDLLDEIPSQERLWVWWKPSKRVNNNGGQVIFISPPRRVVTGSPTEEFTGLLSFFVATSSHNAHHQLQFDKKFGASFQNEDFVLPLSDISLCK